MEKQKELWFYVDKNLDVSILDKVFQLSYATLFIPFSHRKILDAIQAPQRLQFAFLVHSEDEAKACLAEKKWAGKIKAIFVRDAALIDRIRSLQPIALGFFIAVNDKQSLDQAVLAAPLFDFIAIEFTDPTNIPLELVLATAQAHKVKVIKKVQTAEDGSVSSLTMEHGSDGILLNSSAITEIAKLSDLFELSVRSHFDLKEAVVTKTRHAGMGDRVCIDTTSELFQDEGMLLGSTSSGGLLTCSETHFLPYMNLRPFRVNAGGLHLYVWGPQNQAVYLSDLKAGDQVYVINSKGKARTVTVGRLKIERRPLLHIEAKIGNQTINTFIQDDWHVRMTGSKGEIRPSSEIKEGDKLLGFLDQPGRHVGIKINETIKEV